MEPKFTNHDRMLLAGMALQGILASKEGRDAEHQAVMAAEAADRLILALVRIPAPDCVVPDRA